MTSKRKHDGREIYTRTVAGRDHVHHQNRAAFVHGGMGNITNIREIRVHQNFAAFVHGGMGNITNNNEERPELQEVCYKMDSAPRGLCYIFNNKHFEGRSPRFGTDKDRDGLKEVWEKLQFVVTTFDDFKTHEMEEKLLELSKLEVSENCDCLVVIFLTYGKKGAVQGTDNEWLTVNSITSPFKIGRCPSLTGKPKLFFFQSFRGGKNQTVQMDGGDTVEVMNKLTEADFFLGFATVVGTVSLRDVENGSWFIQEMIQTLQKSANRYL